MDGRAVSRKFISFYKGRVITFSILYILYTHNAVQKTCLLYNCFIILLLASFTCASDVQPDTQCSNTMNYDKILAQKSFIIVFFPSAIKTNMIELIFHIAFYETDYNCKASKKYMNNRKLISQQTQNYIDTNIFILQP